MPEIDLASAIETNVVKLGTLEMEAHADKIIVVQDSFVSGYECARCGGRDIRNEVSYIACPECKGKGRYWKEQRLDKTGERANILRTEFKCANCKGTGDISCPDCDGKGGSLVVPDASERRPTTGTIVSKGHLVTKFELGQAILYPSFVGHAFDLEAIDMNGNPVAVVIVIMSENDVLTKVRGHLELRRMKKSVALWTMA